MTRKTEIKMYKRFLLAAGCLLLASCTSFVKITRGGDNVAVLGPEDVTRCTKTGNLIVSVLDRITVVNRPADKVEKDLQTLARNDAATRGGDTIVPTTDVYDGKRNYDIYRCRP